eukprot:g11598.t1
MADASTELAKSLDEIYGEGTYADMVEISEYHQDHVTAQRKKIQMENSAIKEFQQLQNSVTQDDDSITNPIPTAVFVVEKEPQVKLPGEKEVANKFKVLKKKKRKHKDKEKDKEKDKDKAKNKKRKSEEGEANSNSNSATDSNPQSPWAKLAQ